MAKKKELRLLWRPDSSGTTHDYRVWHPSWPGDVFEVLHLHAFQALRSLCVPLGVVLEAYFEEE